MTAFLNRYCLGNYYLQDHSMGRNLDEEMRCSVIYGTLVLIPPLGMLQCVTVLDGMILARPLPPAVDPLLEPLLLLLDLLAAVVAEPL